ncbi:MAG: hypothetical protein RLZZ232_2254, partial [Planctomycetota bacterium]
LGLVLKNGSYALKTSGDVGLVGLTGLSISGSFAVQSNQLGVPVNETVWTPAGDVGVTFPTSDRVLSFGGSAVISVAGIFEISGEIQATKTDSDVIFIDIPQISAALNINGLQVFQVGGRARFSIGGEDGFQLLDVGLTSVRVFGLDVSAVAGALPTLALPATDSTPPVAELTTIVDGIDAGLLSRRRYLDVTLRSPGSLPLNVDSVLDAGAEFTLTGAGVADAQLSTVEHLEGNTFRYYLTDRDPSNDTPLFTAGEISMNFQAGQWEDGAGVTNAAATDSFTARDGKASTGSEVNLGPLVLQGPHFGLEDFQFKPLKNADGSLKGARITITVGLGVDHAELNFGSSSSVLSTSLDDLSGLFDVNVDISPSLSIIGGGLGKFSLGVGSMNLDVADVLKAEATGVTIQYNPERDTDNDGVVSAAEQSAYDNQVILSLESASVTITPLSLTGSLSPYTRDNGTTIPGLQVRNNGFQLGQAEIAYTGGITFGSFLHLDDVRAGITDFGVNFSGSVAFDGEVYIASGGAALFPGGVFSMEFQDSSDADSEAVRAGLSFTGGVPSGFQFSSDLMKMQFGSVLTVTGKDIEIDTAATGDEYVVSVTSIAAELNAGPLKLGGEMRNFAISASGTFVTRPGFGVFISADKASGDSFQWPSWLPIRVTELGLQWEDLQTHPERFSIIISAAVDEIKGIPNVKVSGAIQGVRIDIGALQDGRFPITDIESISVSMKGDLFGGQITAGLLGGILKLDSAGNLIGALDTTTAVADRVFFIGVEGGFAIAGQGGFKIRFAISELGPLGVEVVGDLPEGILLEPISGLKLSGFSGSVQFFTSLPAVYDPQQLLDEKYSPALSGDTGGGSSGAGEWLTTVRQQVVSQYKALKANPVAGGFFAAFLNPMLITGGAQFTLHPPQEVLKGNVEVRLSTDGKVLLTGDMLLMGGLQRVPVRLYGNLSEIAKGNATFLMVAQDVPAGLHPIVRTIPNPLLLPPVLPVPTSVEIQGGITMRYYDSSGKEVNFFHSGSSSPATVSAQLISPPAIGDIALATLASERRLRVKFTPAASASLQTTSITDSNPELELLLPDGTTVTIPGSAVQTENSETIFDYSIPAGVSLEPGEYQVKFLAGSWKDSLDNLAAAGSATFMATGASLQLAAPQDGARFDRRRLNQGGRLAIRFQPTTGALVNATSISDAAAEFTLSGAGVGTAVLSGAPFQDSGDSRLWYFPFTGQFASGPVQVNFPAEVFEDSTGSTNAARVQSFTVTATEGSLFDPQPGTPISAAALNQRGWLEVRFTAPEGSALDAATITDTAPEFTLLGAAAQNVIVSDSPVAVAGMPGVYRYSFTGSFSSGPVEVLYGAGVVADIDGILSAERTQSFTATGVQAAVVGLSAGSIGSLAAINSRGYIDVLFTPSSPAATLDTAFLADSVPEFSLSGSAVAGVTLAAAAPTLQPDGSYRYAFTGSFAAGDVILTWNSASLQDTAGYSLTAGEYRFGLDSAAIGLIAPANEQRVDMSEINSRGYIDVQFVDPTGRGLDVSSITDPAQEFTLLVKNDAGNWVPPVGVGINGVPTPQGDPADLIYRYNFSGAFVPGIVRVQFIGDSFRTVDGATSAALEQQFAVVADAPAFEIRIDGSLLWRTGFSQGLYGDIGDPKLLMDLVKMFEPIVGPLGDGSKDAVAVLKDILQVIDTGVSVVQPFLAEPMIKVKGFVRMGTQALLGSPNSAGQRDVIGVRTTLDAGGAMSAFMLGPVGAAAARFVLEASTEGLKIWGVAELQAGLQVLQPFGIRADAFANLQFNSTTVQRQETLTFSGMGSGGSDQTQTYTIEPQSFMISAAGKLLFHVPDFDGNDETFGTELFRLSGVYSMQINPEGLEVLAQGTIQIGPPELQLFNLSALGVLAIRESGFATDLLITAHAGVHSLASIDGSFRFVTNVSSQNQEVRVPQRFIDGGYLPADFIASLAPTSDPDDGEQLAYVVPGGAPQWDGTIADFGPYAVMQGSGSIYLLDLFVVEADFRIEASVHGLFVQAEGGLLLKELGKAHAQGYLRITSAGLVTALTVDLEADTLRTIGIDLDVNAELQINTTDQPVTITPLTDRLLLTPITIAPGIKDIKAEGLLAIRVPQTSTELGRISGVFSLDTSAERVTVFAHGDLEIGPRDLRTFDMEATGVFALTNDGFASDLVVTATGGLASIAQLTGTFRLISNLTGIEQEVPVPQRFIDGGFLPADFVNRLQTRPSNPARKFYVVPAGAPYLDGQPDDPPSTYMAIMGQGTLRLVDTWNITGGFRMKVTTDGPVIPIHAQIDFGPLGEASIDGKVELRLSGLTVAATVDLSTPGLAAAGARFSADGELMINTGIGQAEIDVDDNPATPPMVIPGQTSNLQAGGTLSIRVPQTDVELIGIQGTFLMLANNEGLSVLATGQTSLLSLISMQVEGAFFIRADGVAAEIDMALQSPTAVPAFSSVFNLSVAATAIFNSTGQAQSIVVPPRFENHLSDRARARLTVSGDQKTYTVPAGAPAANGTEAAAGPYAVFVMNGALTLASTFHLSGAYRMRVTGSFAEFSFAAAMTLNPIGTVDASGLLTVTSAGVYGGIQLGGSFELGSLDAFGAMQLELNTTSGPQTIERRQYDFPNRRISNNSVNVTLPASTQRIFISGVMAIPGFRLEGAFELVNSSDVISITMDASFEAFGANLLHVNGSAVIVKQGNTGMVLSLQAVADVPLEVDGVFELDADFHLKINTRSGSGQDQYDIGLPRNSSRIDWNGSLTLLALLKLQGSGSIEYAGGQFQMDVSVSMDVLGNTVGAQGRFTSEGEFELNFGANMMIGAPGFGVTGSASFHISRADSNGVRRGGDENYEIAVSGYIGGSVQLFGLSLASASISFGLERGTGRVYITPKISINLLFTTIEVSTTFNLFYVKVPPRVYLAGNADDQSGQAFRGGVLYLNMGQRAHMRNESPEEENEGFIVQSVDPDPDIPGEAVRVRAFGRSNTFFGVTAIVADGDTGYDYISIMPGVNVPVYLTGGTFRDTLLYNGSGSAVLDGGVDDDTLQGGEGSNVYKFRNSPGRDSVTALPGSSNEFAFTDSSESLNVIVQNSGLLIEPSNVNLRTIGSAQVNGQAVTLIPFGDAAATVVMPGHNLQIDDTIVISDCQTPAWNGQFVVRATESNTISISRPAGAFASSGIATSVGEVYHDGSNTAYVYTHVENWTPGTQIAIFSSTNAINGAFEVQKINDFLYTFQIPWQQIEGRLQTSVVPNVLRTSSAADTILVAADYSTALLVSDSAGGIDVLEIFGTLATHTRLTQSLVRNGELQIQHAGIDRIILRDPQRRMTLGGAELTDPLNLGPISLGVIAESVTLPASVTAAGLELNLRDSLVLTSTLSTLDLNIRVLGDDQNITVTAPLTAGNSIQLIAPDGTVTLPAGNQLSTHTAVIKARQLQVPGDALNTVVSVLTIVTSENSTGGLQLVNDRDLLLTRNTDADHLVQLDGSLAAVFSNITWVAAVSAEWAENVFDGALNPYAVLLTGNFAVSLPGYSVDDEDQLTADGQLQSRSGSLQFTADELEFLGGAASVRAPGSLIIRSATTNWNYRLGTSAESAAGEQFVGTNGRSSLDLGTRDLAALADGFTDITIGHSHPGNSMRLGDAYPMTTVKATGLPRVVDASIKDPLTLLAQAFTVEGDFRAPDLPLSLHGRTLEVTRTNLHTPTNANLDSGLAAQSLNLQISEQVLVTGWLRADSSLNIETTATTGENPLQSFPNGANSFKGDVGADVRTLLPGSQLTITASGSVLVAATLQAPGAGSQLQVIAGTRFELQQGGILKTSGADSQLQINGGQSFLADSGSAILAGVDFQQLDGQPVPFSTGANSSITLTATGEMWLAGSVSSTG